MTTPTPAHEAEDSARAMPSPDTTAEQEPHVMEASKEDNSQMGTHEEQKVNSELVPHQQEQEQKRKGFGR